MLDLSDMQIVAIRISEAEISEFQWCTLSAHFMASRIVAPVVDTADAHRPDAHEALGTFMQETWPVHSNVESFCQVGATALTTAAPA